MAQARQGSQFLPRRVEQLMSAMYGTNQFLGLKILNHGMQAVRKNGFEESSISKDGSSSQERSSLRSTENGAKFDKKAEEGSLYSNNSSYR